nr:uncharacterized protein LOC111505180 [Leptinotarsa decemlineata]
MMEHPQFVKTIQTVVTPDLEKIEAHFISENWVGIDCNSDILLSKTNKKSKTNLGKSTKKQETKLPSYIQMFLDMYMKTKKKPTKENPTKKAESDEKKNEKVKAINDRPNNLFSKHTAEAAEDGIITSTVQKLADKNVGFHFMAGNADIIGKCLQDEKRSTAGDNKLSEKVRTTEKIEQDSNKDLNEYNYDNDQIGNECDKSINKYTLCGDISETCEFSNDLFDDFFECDVDVDDEFFGACEEGKSDQWNTSHNAKNPECFVNELNPENTSNNCHDEIRKVHDEKNKLCFNFLDENKYSLLLDGQKYSQKDNQNIDHSQQKNMCDDVHICPTNANIHSRSNIHELFGSHKDQMENTVNRSLELSDVESINEESIQNEKRAESGRCESRESESNQDSVSKIFNSQMQQRKICKNSNSDREGTQTNSESTEIQSENTKLFTDFDTVLKNDASLLSIRQKYAYGENIQENGASSNNNFIKENSQKNLNNSQENIKNHWFYKINKRRKRGLEDIHPAEQFENKIYREEKKVILNEFKKPNRKKINHYPQTDLYPNSTISNQKYTITEVLEPNKKASIYDFEADIGRERMGKEKENQKSIKWRSPLVMSPAVKFSPKMNFSGQLFKENDIGAQNNIFNETLNTSVLSKNSRNGPNSTQNIQKTPRQPKNNQNIFQNYKHRGTKFPLCDNDYCVENLKSKEADRSLDYSDIFSSSILGSHLIEEQKKNTPKRYKQCEPSSATDYYTQFVNQSIAQKDKSDEKTGSFERKSSSPSNSEKENIPKEDISVSRNSSLSQIIRSPKNFTLSQDMLESEALRKTFSNSFVDSREMRNSVLSQNRPLTYDQNSSHQINFPDRYEDNMMHPTQAGRIYNNSSLIQPSIAPEYSVNTSVYPLQDPRYLTEYGSQKLSRPTETMISGHMQTMMPCNTQNMNVHYPRSYPNLEYYRSLNDSFRPDPNHFPYSPIGPPENYRYPPWPGMPFYYNPEVHMKQDYPYPDYYPNFKAPDSYMTRQISNFDDIQNMSFANNSQVTFLNNFGLNISIRFGIFVNLKNIHHYSLKITRYCIVKITIVNR